MLWLPGIVLLVIKMIQNIAWNVNIAFLLAFLLLGTSKSLASHRISHILKVHNSKIYSIICLYKRNKIKLNKSRNPLEKRPQLRSNPIRPPFKMQQVNKVTPT